MTIHLSAELFHWPLYATDGNAVECHQQPECINPFFLDNVGRRITLEQFIEALQAHIEQEHKT
jgi:hypothetical protein